jgi:long-chain acyl-CoA synthetase
MLCSGYLHDDEQTDKLFVDQTRKWVRTGDIGKWDSDNYLMIVDRVRSVFKLAQGEYVAAELLTLTSETAALVSQIFVYGDASREWLVAIVVPDKGATDQFFGVKESTDEQFARFCKEGKLVGEIKKQLDELAGQRKFPGYQRIRKLARRPVGELNFSVGKLNFSAATSNHAL